MSSLRLTQNYLSGMVLTPQLRQRIEMLQMTTLELSELIQNETRCKSHLGRSTDRREFEEISEK
jgi:DNA-directed RNA polymerase specialized sigma54-like protein